MALDCAARVTDPFHCWTKWELFEMLLALLPPGRAWQNPDSPGPVTFAGPGDLDNFELGESSLGTEPTADNLTTLEQFWAAYAELLEYVHQRICTLVAEMFCDTTTELRPEWGIAFGYPDPCEPYENLCAKVYAVGGASLDFLRSLSIRANANLTIDDKSSDDTLDPNTIRVRVPAVEEGEPLPQLIPFATGAIRAGHRSPCITANDAIAVCLIERVRHAHLTVIYEVV